MKGILILSNQVKNLEAKVVNGVYELKWYVGKNTTLWNNILDRVKMVPGRMPDKDVKGKFIWKVPINSRTTALLTEIGFRIKEEKVVEVKREKVKPNIDDSYKKLPLHNVDDRLYPFQREGVQFLKAHNYNGLLADPCGSGKSNHAISCMREGNLFPAICIVPATLKLNWEREFNMWMPPNHGKKVCVVEGKAPRDFSGYDVLIANYDILFWLTDSIISTFKPIACFLDEAQGVKTGSSLISKYYPDYPLKANEFVHTDSKGIRSIHKCPPKRTQAVQAIVGGLTDEQKEASGIEWNGVQHFVALSATFILNSPGDLFNVLQLLDPKRFMNRDKFEDYFCKTQEGFKKNTVKITGGKNMDILNKLLLEKYMLRRDMSVILPNVPPIINSVILMEMEAESQKKYTQIEEDFQNYLHNTKEISERACNDRFRLLLQTACAGKMKKGIKFVEELLADPKEKVVLFCHHKAVVEELYKHFGKKAVKLNGECSLIEKQQAVDDFQNDKKIRVFIGNIMAASVGITLTRANKCVFFETGYSSALVHQASSRTARIGQERDTCISYFIQSVGTIEEIILAKLDKKQKMADKILDGIDTEEDDLLAVLWREYLNK